MYIIKKLSERSELGRCKELDGFNVLLKSEKNEEIGFLVDISHQGAAFEYIHT